MKEPHLALAMGYLDEDLIAEAAVYKPAKKKAVYLWRSIAAAAACLCVLFGIAVYKRSDHSQPGTTVLPIYTLPESEEVYVELFKVWKDEYYSVIVDAADNSIFPTGTTIRFNLMLNTQLYLSDGTHLDLDEDKVAEMTADKLGWGPGTVLRITFRSYSPYDAVGDNFLDPERIDVVKAP